MHPAIPAHSARDGLILLHAGLVQLQPKVQQLRHDALRLRRLFLHDLLGEGFHGHVLIGQPGLQLSNAARILKPGQLLCPLTGCFRKSRIDSHGVFDELPVNAHTPVVDDLIQRVQLPFMLRQRPGLQCLAHSAFRLHVLRVVFLVQCPFFRRVRGHVSRPAAVGLGGFTGNGEVADEFLALLHLLLREPQGDGDIRKAGGQRQVGGHHGCASPLMRVEPMPQMFGQAHALKLGVVGHLDDSRVFQCCQDICRKLFAAGKINSHHRPIVIGIGEEKNLEVRGVRVSVHPAFGQRHRAVGFDVDA